MAAASVVWLLIVASFLNLYETRESFLDIQIEHANAQAGSSQGGDSLSDLFEYKATAAFNYVDVLEAFLFLGCMPAFLICLALALMLAGRRHCEKDASRTELMEEVT